MSKMAELAYDIEQLWIEGVHPVKIAHELDCDVDLVYGWIASNGLGTAEESYDPYDTVNS